MEIREFNFNDVSGGSTGLITAAQHIDVSWAREITLAVRWHDGTIGSGQTLSVLAVPDGFTTDDPMANFLDPTRPCATISIDNSAGPDNAAPYYVTYKAGSASTDAAPGAMVSIVVAGTQAQSPTDLDPRLSVDLLLQD